MIPLRIGANESRTSLISANILAGILITKGIDVRIEQIEGDPIESLDSSTDLVCLESKIENEDYVGEIEHEGNLLYIYGSGIRPSLLDEIKTALQK